MDRVNRAEYIAPSPQPDLPRGVGEEEYAVRWHRHLPLWSGRIDPMRRG